MIEKQENEYWNHFKTCWQLYGNPLAKSEQNQVFAHLSLPYCSSCLLLLTQGCLAWRSTRPASLSCIFLSYYLDQPYTLVLLLSTLLWPMVNHLHYYSNEYLPPHCTCFYKPYIGWIELLTLYRLCWDKPVLIIRLDWIHSSRIPFVNSLDEDSIFTVEKNWYLFNWAYSWLSG